MDTTRATTSQQGREGGTDHPEGYFRLRDACAQDCWPFPDGVTFQTLKGWHRDGKIVRRGGKVIRVVLRCSRPGQYLLTCREWLLAFARELGEELP